MKRVSLPLYFLCISCAIFWLTAATYAHEDSGLVTSVETFLSTQCTSLSSFSSNKTSTSAAESEIEDAKRIWKCVEEQKRALLNELEQALHAQNTTEKNLKDTNDIKTQRSESAPSVKENVIVLSDHKKNLDEDFEPAPVKDPLSSFVGAFFVGLALLFWLKSREGFTTKNAAMISGQTVLVFFVSRHCVQFLTWLLEGDWTWFTSQGWPSPKGLITGLISVIIWHFVVLCYYAVRREMDIEQLQKVLPERKSFFLGLIQHFARPEAFVLVFGYLVSVWMFNLLPASYYDYDTPVNWLNVLIKFLLVDFLIYVAHGLEHLIKPLYRIAHKQHHKYINPSLFDAFSGSVADTVCQIVIPLFVSARTLPYIGVHLSNWDFVAFGSIYANQFMLLHIEYRNPWDFLLEMFSIGTSEDHNVHHATFNYNYGHFFMIYDKMFGTYRSPLTVRALVRSTVEEPGLAGGMKHLGPNKAD